MDALLKLTPWGRSVLADKQQERAAQQTPRSIADLIPQGKASPERRRRGRPAKITARTAPQYVIEITATRRTLLYAKNKAPDEEMAAAMNLTVKGFGDRIRRLEPFGFVYPRDYDELRIN